MYTQFISFLFAGPDCFPKTIIQRFQPHFKMYHRSKQSQCLKFVMTAGKNKLCRFVCIYSSYKLSVYIVGLDSSLKINNATVTYIYFFIKKIKVFYIWISVVPLWLLLYFKDKKVHICPSTDNHFIFSLLIFQKNWFSISLIYLQFIFFRLYKVHIHILNEFWFNHL